MDAYLLSNLPISLGKVALLFGPVGNRVLHFHDAGGPGLKDGIQAINDPHSGGFVSAALPDMHSLGHDSAKVLVTPAAAVSKTFSELQRGHLDLLSNCAKRNTFVLSVMDGIRKNLM